MNFLRFHEQFYELELFVSFNFIYSPRPWRGLVWIGSYIKWKLLKSCIWCKNFETSSKKSNLNFAGKFAVFCQIAVGFVFFRHFFFV